MGFFAPKLGPLDFPNLRAFVGVFDAVSLPGLLAKHGGVFQQVADFARGMTTGHSRMLGGPASFRAHLRDLRLLQPAVSMDRKFAHKHLIPRFQTIEKLAVASIELVEGPSFDHNPRSQALVDQSQGDLRLGTKRHCVGYIVFFGARDRRPKPWGGTRHCSLSTESWESRNPHAH